MQDGCGTIQSLASVQNAMVWMWAIYGTVGQAPLSVP